MRNNPSSSGKEMLLIGVNVIDISPVRQAIKFVLVIAHACAWLS